LTGAPSLSTQLYTLSKPCFDCVFAVDQRAMFAGYRCVQKHYVRVGPECYECGAATALHIRDREHSSRTTRTKKRQREGSADGSSGKGSMVGQRAPAVFESHCTSAVG
jgi:hypothetical protein